MLTTSKTSFVLLARPRLWVIVNYIETFSFIDYSIRMCPLSNVIIFSLIASSEQDADEVSIGIIELNLFISTSLNILVKPLYLLYFTTPSLFSHLMKIRTIFHCIDQFRRIMSDTNWRGYMGPIVISLSIAQPFLSARSRSRVSVRFKSHLWRRVLRIVPPFSVLAIKVHKLISKQTYCTYQEPSVFFSGPPVEHILIGIFLGPSKVNFLPSFRL